MELGTPFRSRWVLQRFISDKAGGARPERTGGRRQTHAFAAASRMRNTFIDAGSHTPEQLIRRPRPVLQGHGWWKRRPDGQFNFSVEEGI